MAAYREFTTPRTTQPDPVALLASLRAIAATAGYTVRLDGTYRVKTATALSAASIASIQTAIDTAPALTPQRAAQNEIDAWPIAMRALALTLIDQINVLRAAPGTPLAPITPAQALAAVRAKAGTL